MKLLLSAILCLPLNAQGRDSGRSQDTEILPQEAEVSEHLRLLLKELDYIGVDYQNAVKNGVIVNAVEFDEMQEFAESAANQFLKIQSSLSETESEAIEKEISALRDLISQKSHHNEIRSTTEKLYKKIVSKFDVPVSPESTPNLKLGRWVYQHHCASCHGDHGLGDGLLGKDLSPAPRNFHDADVMDISSPFKFYNILQTGISGTGMASYQEVLTEDQLWSVSFYLSGMSFEEYEDPKNEVTAETYWNKLSKSERDKILDAGLQKDFLASSHNLKLKKWLNSTNIKNIDEDKVLRALRLGAPFLEEVPLNGKDKSPKHAKKKSVSESLGSTLEYVRKAVELAEQGDFQKAEQKLLHGYLFGFEKTEISLGLVEKKLVIDIEAFFMASRGHARNENIAEFRKSSHDLIVKLEEATERYTASLQKSDTDYVWGDFIASFIIVTREGFEAFLVVAALLALLSSLGEVKGRRWVHAGWIAALLSGVLSYYVFEIILELSGAAKESIEAFCTGIAVLMLFYTGFWLLSQTEHQKWNKFVKNKTKQALSSGRLWGLFSIAFIAVYREAAETVLFYSALYSTAKNTLMVSLGFVAGCLTLICICWGIIHFNLKLPVRKFFMTTSCLMVAISVILAGKTVHELIEAGYLVSTPIEGFPVIDLLGLYPSAETLAAQAVLMLLGICIATIILYKQKCKVIEEII